MASAFFSALASELKETSDPLHRLDIIKTLGLLMFLPSEVSQPRLVLRVLLEDLWESVTFLCVADKTLQVVARVSRHLESVHGPGLIHDLLEAWPKLFQWLWNHFPCLNIPPTCRDDTVLNSYYYSAAISILSLYSSHPALLDISAENDATSTDFLVARLWYWRTRGIDLSIPSSIIPLTLIYLNTTRSDPDCQCAVLGIAARTPNLFTAPMPEWEGIHDILLLNNDVSSTIEVLVNAPGAELSASSPNLITIAAHLGLIVALSRSKSHAYAFILHKSPSLAIKAILSLVNLSADVALIAKCISLCVQHLCLILDASHGFEPVLEALDAMLLPALVKCYGRILELNAMVATDEDAVFLLHTVLSKYTIFITVRERVSKSLAIITATGSEVLLVPNSPFAAAWSDFKSLAVQRLQIQERPCRKTKTKAELACCSRCQEAFYCSKACQTYDWKHGDHKKKCVSPFIDRTPDRKKFPVGNRDLRAVDEVLRHDLKLRLPRNPFSTTSHTSADACLTLHSCGTTRQTLFWKETVEIVDGERKLGVDKGIILIMVAAGVTPYST
ncbi:hypothetical protein B0H14DRAFT_2714781, partial [Mycena olivaceomarginata]